MPIYEDPYIGNQLRAELEQKYLVQSQGTYDKEGGGYNDYNTYG